MSQETKIDLKEIEVRISGDGDEYRLHVVSPMWVPREECLALKDLLEAAPRTKREHEKMLDIFKLLTFHLKHPACDLYVVELSEGLATRIKDLIAEIEDPWPVDIIPDVNPNILECEDEIHPVVHVLASAEIEGGGK